MTAAVFSIGTELTRGELANGNGTWLAEQLTAIGHEVTEITVVDDDLERISDLLVSASQRHRVIVATGGLGPTSDDLTRDAVARAAGVQLHRNEEALVSLTALLTARRRSVSPSNSRQADLPVGSTLLANPKGTAVGFALPLLDALAFFLPGVPSEMRAMFVEQVVPRLPACAELPASQIVLRVFGLPESGVGDALDGLEEAHGVRIAYRVHLPDLEVKILARGADVAAAETRARTVAEEIERRLGTQHVYARGDISLATALGQMLLEAGQTIAVAESCTGGLISELLTQCPGAGSYFLGGAVTYADDAKTALLGVPGVLIEEFGAVSEPVAAEMARGIRERLASDYGVSITGLAGPAGGTEQKPVGLVFCGLASAEGQLVERFEFCGDREEIRRRAAFSALAMLRNHLLTESRRTDTLA